MNHDIEAIKIETAIAHRIMAHRLGEQHGMSAETWLAQPAATRLEQLRAAELDYRGEHSK